MSRQVEAFRTHIDYLRRYSERHGGEHIVRSHKEHLRLVDALNSRDSMAARKEMETQVRSAGERVAELIELYTQANTS